MTLPNWLRLVVYAYWWLKSLLPPFPEPPGDTVLRIGTGTIFWDKNRLQTAAFLVQAASACVLVIVTVIYTVYSAFAVTEARNATALAKAQFVTSERPIVLIELPGKTFITDSKGSIETQVYFFNYGKSPALNVISNAVIVKQSGVEDFFATFHAKALEELKIAGSQSILAPDPSKNISSMAKSEPAPDLQTFSRELIMENDYVVVARVEYDDFEGNPHWTELCGVRDEDNYPRLCATHNGSDR